MQIREKGKKVLLIKTEYDSSKKRTFGKTVASQNIGLSTVSKEIRQLSEDESVDTITKKDVDQLRTWLAEREYNQEVNSLKLHLSTFDHSANKAAEALSVERLKDGLSKEKADEIWLALDRMSKAMRKAGFKKPKPEPKQPSTPKAESQQQISLES